eukprot:Nitzschia sp. Nitz4//scaffold134_size62860//19808//22524//NITZ4_006322-RA/size62860-augustus-gene-0.64-mRNA-1//-1//CDS//3329535478//7619//frame0
MKDNTLPSTGPSNDDDDVHPSLATATTTTSEGGHKAKVDSGNRTDTDDASSLSSIPLKQLKKVMQNSRQNAKAAPSPPQPRSASKKQELPDTPVIRNRHDKKKSPTKSPDIAEKSMTSVNGATQSSNNSESSEEEEAACCLCHCGVDCSDRALFFAKDRKQELDDEDGEYYFQLSDPYLPEQLYDRNNALVYCDSCNRLYHQKCHFVPLLVVPRGDWTCLICSMQQTKRTPKKRARGSPKNVPVLPNDEPWKEFAAPSSVEKLFCSPPVVSMAATEKRWELVSAVPKAQLWNLQLKQLHTFLKSQAGNIRMAAAALETLTSTKRNRAHFTTKGKKSQELAQTLVRLTSAQFKIRSNLMNLEHLRLAGNALLTQYHQLLVDWVAEYPNHIQHVFPHGVELFQNHRRLVPRTREMASLPTIPVATTSPSAKPSGQQVPMEISVPSPKTSRKIKSMPAVKPASPRAVTTIRNLEKKKDDDSGITLDDLQCCVCMVGDASDENDVILCDGQGCCRAFHMKCIYPQVTQKDIENEDDDWFCPLCQAISNLLPSIQSACMDEDWDHRRETERYKHLEESSLHSWGNVDDVFPDSEFEFNSSMKLKAGKQNEDTARLLKVYLGDDFFGDKEAVPMPVGSDSEDENDYSLFDEESFDERRRKEKEEHVDDDDDSESSHSSQATLQDMSSVEMKIGKSELAALSEEEDEESSSDDESDSPKRRSRRLRSKTVKSEHSSFADVGADFDESNILEGKRQRKKVDYRKLNDALFGQLSAKEKAAIDDKDDFQVKKQLKEPPRKRAKKEPEKSEEESQESSGNEESSQEGSNEDENSDNSGSNDGSSSEENNSDEEGEERSSADDDSNSS